MDIFGLVAELLSEKCEVTTLYFIKNDSMLVVGQTGYQDEEAVGYATVWDIASRRALHRLQMPRFNGGVGVSNSGDFLAMSNKDGWIGLYRTDGIERIKEVQVSEASPTELFFLVGDQQIVTCDRLGERVVLWDTRRNTVESVIDGFGEVERLGVAPDGSVVVTGNVDGEIGRAPFSGRLTTKVGHDDKVMAIAFAPDSSRFATGSLDGGVRCGTRVALRWSMNSTLA